MPFGAETLGGSVYDSHRGRRVQIEPSSLEFSDRFGLSIAALHDMQKSARSGSSPFATSTAPEDLSIKAEVWSGWSVRDLCEYLAVYHALTGLPLAGMTNPSASVVLLRI